MDRSIQYDIEPSSALSSWERWINSIFVWVPYAALALSVAVAQIRSASTSDRLLDLVLVLFAAGWTWLAFTRLGSPTDVTQGAVRLYFVGFIVIAALLMTRSPIYLVYGITGFFHASLLRPWPLMFAGMAATGFVIHSHIIITESTPTTWAIYLGVVAIQTVAVFAGIYGGQKVTEIAEERRRALERLQVAMDENVGLHEQLVAQAREAGVLDERQRMAREIHDTIAQGLTGVITQIEAINQTWGDEAEVHRRLDTTADLARESLTEVRRSVQAIRPGPLEATRLPEALGDIATSWSAVNEVPVEVTVTGERRPLHPEIEVVLLRAAQEGLANAAKHSIASRVGITLSFLDGSIALDIRDDGKGFDPATAVFESGFGLAAMRQRVENAHGNLQVESAPGEGTALSVRIPTAEIGSPE